MSNGTLWQILAGLLAFLLFAWAWRRIDVHDKPTTWIGTAPEEPCWTEQERREDGLSYGRSHGYSNALEDAEATAEIPRGGWG